MISLRRLAVRRMTLAAVALIALVAVPRDSFAQGFVSPFIGYNFSGDAGCPTITDCDDKNVNWGVGFGALGSVVGFEAEFSYTDNFFGEAPGFESSVLTFMGNFMIAPRFGPVQPYGLVGLGLMKTEAELSADDIFSSDNNDLAWDVGGGLMVFFGDHFGVRGDVRYFHAFGALDLLGIDLGQEEKLDFGRFSGAAVFRF
jgi:opacity protein-like surface antigen